MLFCRPRARLLLALALTIALGLLSRLRPIGWPLYDHSLGDVLYAVAAYIALALVLPRLRPWHVAPLALVLCWAIEAFQATGVPARYAHIALVRWLIGTTFSWHDMVCYAIGVGLIAFLDVGLLRRSS
jgi:hypothetical protein